MVRGGPPVPSGPGPAANMLRRAPPVVGRGITASTKSSGSGANKPTGPKGPSASAAPKPVARVPMVTRAPSTLEQDKQPGKGLAPAPPPLGEKKSHRAEPVRPG